ncbi:hypothetical protein HYE67_002947 [Fusarium culmorum]|uniref:Uncharacterized protein n=1 Tax=Fusarium culmorum TaxID=5516 RepID=A0A2T4GG71_FUSCU|nr:hypothetical protein FCULG_00012628 [Fusarium culmorum]QPC60716.1 hypothetical protein HYE67_002947 [Fusarium culmorum]
MVTQIPQTPISSNTANSISIEKYSGLLQTPQSSIQLHRTLQAVPDVISQDQAEKEEYMLKKRKKVIYNGNIEFVKVPAILKAREQMRKYYSQKEHLTALKD